MAERLVVVGLGASLGDRRRWLRLAVGALAAAEGVRVERVSRPVVSRGIGPGVGPFLNAAVRLTTSRSPEALLGLCKAIEARLGRRPSRRWGERAIDCDILAMDGLTVETAQLQVPHARFWERSFAVGPSREVAPDLVVPGGPGPLRDSCVPSSPRVWWGRGLGGRWAGGRVGRRGSQPEGQCS